jgi:hypothetical protein
VTAADLADARPALVAKKTCAMQLRAGHPQQKGSRRGPAYAYNIKALRDREMPITAQAECSYERSVVARKGLHSWRDSKLPSATIMVLGPGRPRGQAWRVGCKRHRTAYLLLPS